ncbi:MAG: hypothetical protein KF734_17430 [Saprospiraceae bacterium]|nr:hypothetical protein [Saprospiraceae bacterium]
MGKNAISFVALCVSLLFAGAFVGGEIHRQRAMKAELKAIHEEQKRIMAEVAATNQNYLERKQALLVETAQLYEELDSILQQKELNTKQLQGARSRVQKAHDELAIQIETLKDVLKHRRLELDPATTQGQ